MPTKPIKDDPPPIMPETFKLPFQDLQALLNFLGSLGEVAAKQRNKDEAAFYNTGLQRLTSVKGIELLTRAVCELTCLRSATIYARECINEASTPITIADTVMKQARLNDWICSSCDHGSLHTAFVIALTETLEIQRKALGG